MREAGDVCYADVYKDGTGVVEFLRYDDMKYAVKKLDDSRFRSHEASIWTPHFRLFHKYLHKRYSGDRFGNLICESYSNLHCYRKKFRRIG